METVADQVLAYIIIAIIGASFKFILSFFKQKIALAKAQTKDTNLQSLLTLLDGTVSDVVIAVENSLVKAAKADGTWGTETKNKAFQTAFDEIVKIIGDEGKQLLDDSKVDLAAMIVNKIEAYNKSINSVK